jgi:hypothetical protein
VCKRKQYRSSKITIKELLPTSQHLIKCNDERERDNNEEEEEEEEEKLYFHDETTTTTTSIHQHLFITINGIIAVI